MTSSKILLFIGRLFFVAIFLNSGIGKIFNFEGTAGYMESAGMPLPSLFLVGAIVLEIAGGLMLLFNYKPEIGAGLLALFLIPTTLIFHLDFGDQMQQIMFMKNMSILGALIIFGIYNYQSAMKRNKI